MFEKDIRYNVNNNKTLTKCELEEFYSGASSRPKRGSASTDKRPYNCVVTARPLSRRHRRRRRILFPVSRHRWKKTSANRSPPNLCFNRRRRKIFDWPNCLAENLKKTHLRSGNNMKIHSITVAQVYFGISSSAAASGVYAFSDGTYRQCGAIKRRGRKAKSCTVCI